MKKILDNKEIIFFKGEFVGWINENVNICICYRFKFVEIDILWYLFVLMVGKNVMRVV